MGDATQLAEVAAMVGDPARANMLCALLDGRAHTASELAYVARVTAGTASGHLARLLAVRLVTVLPQGRHRYYRLASAEVARMIEAISAVAADGPPRHVPLSREARALREARTCYDHLAGRLAVRIIDRMVTEAFLLIDGDGDGAALTDAGADFLQDFGVDLAAAHGRRRAFCRICLDWTERRPHLGGAVGAALLSRCFDLHWIERVRDSRAVRVTPAGQSGLAEIFGAEPALVAA
jgi:DNA-binding transcriptional ArsR family regulator